MEVKEEEQRDFVLCKTTETQEQPGSCYGGTALQLLLPLLASDQTRTQLSCGLSPGTDVSHLSLAMM